MSVILSACRTPIGSFGGAFLTTLIHTLQARGGGRGAASLCVGGGMGTAMIVEVY